MPDGGLSTAAVAILPGAAPKIAKPRMLCMPTFHDGQERAFYTPAPEHKAIRCGRRWGKTAFGTVMAIDGAAKKRMPIGIFAPDYKRLSETYSEIATILDPITTQASQTAGMIKVRGGGQIEFWTLEDENAGRSRKYKRVIIDEAAFGKDNLTDIWERSIKPTLFDYSGQALVLSNTNGIAEENFFWRICNIPEYGFAQYHAPTHDNPLLPMRLTGETAEDHAVRRLKALEKLRIDNPPLVYQQEYLAEFVDFSGAAFFQREKLLHQGMPVPYPGLCDVVFATIDTAVKDGKEHDSTAVVYWAKSSIGGFPLVALDWDILQIEGSLLEEWLPTVYARLDELTREIRCRLGSVGAFIEDKASGSILLQQARRRDWQAHAIESDLTALGKDARAISVSGYVHRDMVKVSQHAYDKTTALKGVTRNHLLSQLANFKVGDKDANKRADDLTDCFTYGIAVGLGNSEGF